MAKFVLSAERRATMLCKVMLPTEKVGVKVPVSVDVTYRILEDSEFRRLIGAAPDEEMSLAESLAAARKNSDNELLRRTVVDWKSADLVDESGEPVAFSPEALELVIQHLVPLRNEMAINYVKAHDGEGKRKN